MKPQISVIMPVYNTAAYLKSAIDSILAQTFDDFELIIVDDGSTDRSVDIIESFDDKRIIKLFQKNAGYPSALNAALQVARGKYVARMDSDDLSQPTRLEKQFAFLQAHRAFAFVGCHFSTYVTPRGKSVPKRNGYKNRDVQARDGWIEESWQQIVQFERLFADPSVMFRFEAAQAVGFYRTYISSGQDIDLWLRLIENGGKGATLLEALYHVRMHPFSITTRNTTDGNAVVRALASERKDAGTDRVARGEPIDALIRRHQNSAVKSRRASVLWYYASICWAGGDSLSALHFFNNAMRAERSVIGTARRLLQKLSKPQLAPAKMSLFIKK